MNGWTTVKSNAGSGSFNGEPIEITSVVVHKIAVEAGMRMIFAQSAAGVERTALRCGCRTSDGTPRPVLKPGTVETLAGVGLVTGNGMRQRLSPEEERSAPEKAVLMMDRLLWMLGNGKRSKSDWTVTGICPRRVGLWTRSTTRSPNMTTLM